MSSLLYRTDNGGANWTRLSIPIGDPVYFADASNGWAAGGPMRDKLFVTHDGGVTWADASDIAPLQGSGESRAFGLPMAVNGGAQLLLTVTLYIADNPSLLILYSSTDSGDSWKEAAATAIGDHANAGYIVPSYIFASGAVAVFASDGTAYQYAPGDLLFKSFVPTQAGDVRNAFSPTGFFPPQTLDFLDPQHGWALAGDGGCEGFKTDCWQATLSRQKTAGRPGRRS